MSNYAWACFDCRAAVRRPGSAKRVLCPGCGKPCECLGYKTPIPPKAKVKAWEQLRAGFYGARRSGNLAKERAKVRRIHNLEQEIARLEGLPSNAGRSVAISLLKKQLAASGA
jgi:hypothetical protein